MIGCVEKNTRRRMSFQRVSRPSRSVGGTPYCNGDNTSTSNPAPRKEDTRYPTASVGYRAKLFRSTSRARPRAGAMRAPHGPSIMWRPVAGRAGPSYASPGRRSNLDGPGCTFAGWLQMRPMARVGRRATRPSHSPVPAPCKRARADPASAAVRQAAAAVQEAQRLIGTAGAARPSNAPE